MQYICIVFIEKCQAQNRNVGFIVISNQQNIKNTFACLKNQNIQSYYQEYIDLIFCNLPTKIYVLSIHIAACLERVLVTDLQKVVVDCGSGGRDMTQKICFHWVAAAAATHFIP